MTTEPTQTRADAVELARVEELNSEARRAAEQADPLRDGSYFGDAAKAPLIDTPDLEAGDPQAAPTQRWVTDPDEAV